MKFEIDLHHRDVPDESLIHDVKEVAKRTGRDTVTMREYETFGKYHPTTLRRRFRSWFTVLQKAGLQKSRSPLNIPEEELFDNIKDVWISLGRQPRYSEIRKPLSRYSAGTYEKRFGSWQRALGAFVAYINTDSAEDREAANDASAPENHADRRGATRRTKREISERLRFSILMRDGFRCQSCGRSPLKSPGIELQVDHILPWSQGGETTADNLQAKCRECNQGKGNAFDK
jgi:5-methylcytosine-specific restriction endonuclease McrA